MSKYNDMENLNNNDPSNWKWGVIYFNKKDKRLFVPKKIAQNGWTINAANRYALLLLAGIALLIFLWSSIQYANGYQTKSPTP